VVNPSNHAGSIDKGTWWCRTRRNITMTTRVLDRRDRSVQITLLAPIAAGVVLAAFVAFTAFGGGGLGNDGGAAPPPASPSPSAPAETPEPDETPVATPDASETPVPSEPPAPTADADDGGNDAMPIKVDLDNATGADVHVDIADTTGLLVDAASGTPGDGISVEAYTLKVENLDATTLQLTWIDYPIDNALALYIDESDGGIRLLLVQPEPTGTTDAIGFDRELILSFSGPVSADQVQAFLQDGLDTPG
jgi:hypothetical protein